MKLNLAAGNDNRPRIDADFRQMPELFLRTYSRELIGWAAEAQAMGKQALEIALWNRPGATILSPGYQGKVTVRCEAMANPVNGSVLLVVQPESPQDAAIVRLHCEALPGIIQAIKEKADLTKGTARGAVRAVFDLPDYFVQRYGLELREWGRNFSQIGLVKTIVLREGNLSDMSPDPEQGAVLLGVKLQARIERMKGDEMQIVISPMREQDERVIANHVQKMTSVGIRPRAELVEPPRPGMPFMPTIAGAKRNADGGI